MRYPIHLFLFVLLTAFCAEMEARDFQNPLPYKKKGNVVNYKKNGRLILKNTLDVGFGALAFSVLTVLDEFEQGKMAGLTVNFDSGCYLDPELGPNWWEYFFEPIALGNNKATPFFLTKRQMLLTSHKRTRISRQRTTELVKKYLIFKPELKEEVDGFIEKNFEGNYVIGIHHRGTDKKIEVALVPFEHTLKVLFEQIDALSPSEYDRLRIYVATDEQAFLDKVIELYPSIVIYNDFVRSNNQKPLHYSQNLYGSNYQKGKETVIDCFLLSQCNLLIYPEASSYSQFSAAMNADMQLVPLH